MTILELNELTRDAVAAERGPKQVMVNVEVDPRAYPSYTLLRVSDEGEFVLVVGPNPR